MNQVNNETTLRQLLKTLPIKTELRIPERGNRIPFLKMFLKKDGEIETITLTFSGVNKCKTFIKWLIKYGKN